MKLTPEVGRNDPCPCGSGRKFKVCCQEKASSSSPTRRSPVLYLALGGAGVVLAVVVGQTFFGPASSDRLETAPKNASARSIPLSVPVAGGSGGRPSGLMSQPPGPAPEGKVWSPEHGHWHDLAAPTGQAINAGGNSTPTPAGPASFTPQPAGPVPEGKVWSPEHGHWHDVNPPPTSPTPTANPSPPVLDP